MKITHKQLFAFLGAISMLNFYVPPVEAESHASSEAPLIIRQRRGAWRRMQQQARREEAARKREHERFENEHKMRYQKESRDRERRLNNNQARVRTYKWKKRNK